MDRRRSGLTASFIGAQVRDLQDRLELNSTTRRELKAEIARQSGALVHSLNDYEQAARRELHRRLDSLLANFRAAIRAHGHLVLAWPEIANQLPERPSIPKLVRYGVDTVDVCGRALETPQTLPLRSAPAPIVIRATLGTDGIATSLLQSLVLRLALSLGTTARYTFVDPTQLGKAFPFSGRLPNERPRDLRAEASLRAVIEDIARIQQEHLSSRAPNLADLGDLESEQFEVVAISRYPMGLSPHELSSIETICRNGPRAGKYIVITHRADVEHPEGRQPAALGDHQLIDLDQLDTVRVDQAPPPDLEGAIADHVSQVCLAPRVISWHEEVGLPREQWWSGDAAAFVETPIGSGAEGPLVFWLGERDDGRIAAHGVLAGQTGAGKSTLYHTIIMGLAVRYSPDQLQLILIDGKQGVSFQPYAELPHARVVSLNTHAELARSILPELLLEAEERYTRFRSLGVENLIEYRRSAPDEVLPRIVVFIDEYQQLFLEDSNGDASADLRRLVEQGRGAGIHLVLASQQFKVDGLRQKEAIFGQLRLRMSLALIDEYRTSIREFGRDGRELLAKCTERGDIVLNDLGGADGANRLGRVSYQPGEQRRALITGLATRSGAKRRPPIVLDGGQRPQIAENPLLDRLICASSWPTEETWQNLAKCAARHGGIDVPDWHEGEAARVLWFGRQRAVYGQAQVVLRRRRAENVLIAGGEPEDRLAALLSAAVSIAIGRPPDATEFWVADYARTPWNGLVRQTARAFEAAGIRLQATEKPGDLTTVAEERGDQPGSTFLLLAELDSCDTFHPKGDRYPPKDSPAALSLHALAETGPSAGIHVLATFSTVSAVRTILKGSVAAFRHRIAFPMPEADSHHFVNARHASKLGNDGASAVLHDAQRNVSLTFAPNAMLSAEDLGRITNTLDHWRNHTS